MTYSVPGCPVDFIPQNEPGGVKSAREAMA